jgi:hypothetical protein
MFGVHRRLADIALGHVTDCVAPKILDLASDNGGLSRRLLDKHPNVEVTVTALDPMVVGNLALSDLGNHPRALVCDATAIDAPDGYFDLAVVARPFRHVPPATANWILGEGTRTASKLLIVDLGWLASPLRTRWRAAASASRFSGARIAPGHHRVPVRRSVPRATAKSCRLPLQRTRFVAPRGGWRDTGNPVEHVDKLIDDLVDGQRKMSVQPRHADLLCGSDESVSFESHVLRWGRIVVVGGESEPEFDCARWESVAVLREWPGLGLNREQPYHPGIAQEGAYVNGERGAGVTAGADLDRRGNDCHEIAGHVFEDRLGERVYRSEILVEVPLSESSFGADVNDSDGRDSPRSEQLEAGIDQSLAALVTPVGGADATVRTRHGRDR